MKAWQVLWNGDVQVSTCEVETERHVEDSGWPLKSSWETQMPKLLVRWLVASSVSLRRHRCLLLLNGTPPKHRSIHVSRMRIDESEWQLGKTRDDGNSVLPWQMILGFQERLDRSRHWLTLYSAQVVINGEACVSSDRCPHGKGFDSPHLHHYPSFSQ